VFLTPTCDVRIDSLAAQPITMTLRVISPVGIQGVGAAARMATSAPHRRDRFDQRHQLGDVMAVAAGQRDL
jgi:hypothetical protein